MTLKPAEIEYTELRRDLAEMSEAVCRMISGSVDTLVTGNAEKARQIMEADKQIDELDLKIDELCTRIIALYEPKASDLRYIITALRIIVDLERIGDHCRNICKQSIKLSAMPKVKDYIDLPNMALAASLMVKGAIDAYFSKDEAKALAIIKEDEKIDAYQNQITRELITYIMEDVTKTKAVIKLINITRRLERIADHGKNIAELVSFMVTGKILRHQKTEGGDEQSPAD